MKAGRRLLPLVALLALILAACGDPSTDSSENGGGEVSGAAGADTQIEASNFAFQPTKLSVDSGASTTLEFTNGDDVEHSFTSDDLGLDEVVEGGANATITIDAPDEDGTHEFHCKFHPQMTGKIVVGSGGAGGGESDKSSDGGGGGGGGGGYDY
jgi:plastocyanin